MTAAFQYLPLDAAKEEIRILTLEPGKYEDDIFFSVEHASIRDDIRQSYETISYAWEEATVRSTVYITDGFLPASSTSRRAKRSS